MTGRGSAPEQLGIAITGLGVLSPLGDSVAGFGAALRKGRCSIEAAAEFDGACVAQLRDFDATRYAKVRGMRVYARATQLEICATVLALGDAGFADGTIDPLQLGLVTASSFSHLETLLEYDQGLTSVGMQRTNPTLMPLGLPSAPGAAVALALGAKAFAITLNDGGASGLAALGLGARLLAAGRARICVVAGASTLCRELVLSAARAGLLCKSAPIHVLDEASEGMAFGEAAAAIVLEPTAGALARGRRPLGFVCGQASTFARDFGELVPALTRACHAGLRRAGVGSDTIALVSSGAGGVPASDRAHARALLAVFGASPLQPCVTTLKGNLGESLDPSGLLQCVAALHALRERVAPPIPDLRQPCVPGLRYLKAEAELQAGGALLTAASDSGACTSLILSIGPE